MIAEERELVIWSLCWVPPALVCTLVLEAAVCWTGMLFWTLMAAYHWLKASLIGIGIRRKKLR